MADTGFHLLNAKHGVVMSASRVRGSSASTSIINPSNARAGADDHAALSAMELREPAPVAGAAASRHCRRRAGGGGIRFCIVAYGLGADIRRTGAAFDHAIGQ